MWGKKQAFFVTAVKETLSQFANRHVTPITECFLNELGFQVLFTLIDYSASCFIRGEFFGIFHENCFN